MKEILFKITTIFLALLVMFASLSFNIASHFCNNQVVAVSFIGMADTCKDTKSSDCCKELLIINKEQISSEPCCKDNVSFIEGISFVNNYVKNDLQKVISFLVLQNLIDPVFFLNGKNTSINYAYLSPKITLNFQTTFQIFLI